MIRGRIALLFFILAASLASASGSPVSLPRVEDLGPLHNSDANINECTERCGADGAGCAGEEGNVGVDLCLKHLSAANSALDSSDDNNNCFSSWLSDGVCDSSQNNVECGYDGGDCCSCDCGREVTVSEVDGTMYVETIFNGTVTVEAAFPNGTTVVTTDVTDVTTTTWPCGVYATYACIDPSSSCVDDDDYTASSDDDSSSVECENEMWACFFDEECLECLESGSSSSTTSEDDVLDNCPLSSTSCSGYADFYCCALEESLDDECANNRKIVDLIDCFHTAEGNTDCGFESFCFNGASTAVANPAFAAAFGIAVAGLVVATAALF